MCFFARNSALAKILGLAKIANFAKIAKFSLRLRNFRNSSEIFAILAKFLGLLVLHCFASCPLLHQFQSLCLHFFIDS